jgi:hypothetical protein
MSVEPIQEKTIRVLASILKVPAEVVLFKMINDGTRTLLEAINKAKEESQQESHAE